MKVQSSRRISDTSERDSSVSVGGDGTPMTVQVLTPRLESRMSLTSMMNAVEESTRQSQQS